MKISCFILFIVLSVAWITCYAGNVYIFVSFSMPKESIKGWMNEGEKVGAPVIIRGLVNNSFKETIKKVGELVQDNKGGVQLNPILFQKFHIDKVPAVVVVTDSVCLPSQSCKDEYDIIYGDVTLSYALNKIADQKDAVSEIAKSALLHLRGDHAA